eukprot:GHVT01020188.1.p1 GENE.GHVT01020188.1~~GHVT01020188.1.p1  ORF type:complete len:330 (-),score=37.37 GHVT01020188.1:2847-3836(-)
MVERIKGSQDERGDPSNQDPVSLKLFGDPGDTINLGSAFEYFSAVSELVRKPAVIFEAVTEVIDDFAAEGVKYLELRTTPKHFPDTSLTPSDYVDLMIKAIQWGEEKHMIMIRLILSIDRATITDDESAKKAVNLVFDLASRSNKIVGFDVAGDPRKGNITKLLDELRNRLQHYRQSNDKGKFLGLTVHTGEIPSPARTEVDDILKCLPNRLGHCCYLTDKQQLEVVSKQIPVEMCPTSNLQTMQLRNMRDHHFCDYYSSLNYRNGICVCTDDTGLFETSLSAELHHIATAFGLSVNDIQELQLAAVSAAFCSAKEKDFICKQILHSLS